MSAGSLEGALRTATESRCMVCTLRYPFSNYVRGYTGLLDYVWFEPDRLEVQA